MKNKEIVDKLVHDTDNINEHTKLRLPNQSLKHTQLKPKPLELLIHVQ